MMRIAHRGNLNGPKPELENTPAYIQMAIDAGYYVEVDVWGYQDSLYLGHDKPLHPVSFEYFREREGKLFCHCKNVKAMTFLRREIEWPCYFFHNTDDYTMTSNGFIWCYPGKRPPGPGSIVVLPELSIPIDQIQDYLDYHEVDGVCSDYVECLPYK